MKRIKVLIADKHCPDEILEKLEEKHFETIRIKDNKRESLISEILDKEVLVVSGGIQVDRTLIERAKKLKLIVRAGSGMEIIDTLTAGEFGIVCQNTAEGNADSVAEHALGMILTLLHKLNKADKEVKNFEWQREPNRGVEFSKKTLGIIGYGNTGMKLAKKVSGMDVNVLAYDIFKLNFSDKYANEANLNQIFRETDILSIHLPLTEKTRYMIDDNFLGEFQKPIYLINTSRGEVVSLESIIKGLDKGILKGAGLDVLEKENLSIFNIEEKKIFENLSKRENVILTPHVAGWSEESRFKIGNSVLTRILKFFGRD
ncbi:MAG: hypothetical protein EA412_06170 [Chitinophagaceae bacterium]|nr:MAG: hypothetical protein EA412_06170 [Chitinophagaceae bacterium]